jgi:excisionase family DNA binding protein
MEWLTTEEAAERLGIKVRAVQQAIAEGRIPADWLSRKATRGRPWLLASTAVDRWAELRRPAGRKPGVSQTRESPEISALDA